MDQASSKRLMTHWTNFQGVAVRVVGWNPNTICFLDQSKLHQLDRPGSWAQARLAGQLRIGRSPTTPVYTLDAIIPRMKTREMPGNGLHVVEASRTRVFDAASMAKLIKGSENREVNWREKLWAVVE